MTTVADSSGAQSDPEARIRYEDINVPVSGPCEHFNTYDTLREQGRGHFGTAGPADSPFWLFTHMEDIRTCFQDTASFSNRAVTPEMPDPPFMWIPEMLDAPLHTNWRRLLGPFFAPGAVDRLKPRVNEVITEILDEVAERGHCDYVADVALRFPNTIFMELMGLPVEDAAQFQVWETAILHGGATSGENGMRAMQEVMGYFAHLIARRRKDPRQDILSTALTWTIEGEKVTDQDLLSFCLLMFMAGLDTVAMQLSYSMLHLAQNDQDRRRLVAEPSLFPSAIEEFLRYYAFVAPGRKAIQDTEVGGCPVKVGQMVWLPLASANRDPNEFSHPDVVDIERTGNRHLAFGAGPHRCLGSHLARQELLVGLTEWHRRIPEYRIDPSIEIVEHGGQVGLSNLPLVWDVPPGRGRS
jgi:cytochrome P450